MFKDYAKLLVKVFKDYYLLVTNYKDYHNINLFLEKLQNTIKR